MIARLAYTGGRSPRVEVVFVDDKGNRTVAPACQAVFVSSDSSVLALSELDACSAGVSLGNSGTCTLSVILHDLEGGLLRTPSGAVWPVAACKVEVGDLVPSPDLFPSPDLVLGVKTFREVE